MDPLPQKKIVLISTISLLGVFGILLWQNFSYAPGIPSSPYTALVSAPATMCKATMPPELAGKLFVGYQGWFRTPADGTNKGWTHWGLSPLSVSATSTSITVDMWPDVTQYPSTVLSNLQTVGTALAKGSLTTLGNGNSSQLFTSASSQTTDLHMSWMQQYGITGAFLQRFASEMNNDANLSVIAPATKSAEKYGRKVAVTYDITGAYANPNCYINGGKPDAKLGSANPNFSISQCIKADWTALVAKGIVSSPAYLKVTIGGVQKPLVEIWGFGFNGAVTSDAPAGSQYMYNTADALALIQWFKSQGVAVMGGVPTNWRTQNGDSLSGSAWMNMYKSFDIISPWMVGRYSTPSAIDAFVQSTTPADICAAQTNAQGYMPVIFSGYSFFNTPRARNTTAYASTDFPLNQTPRACGQFLWQQFADDSVQGLNSYYLAMFDEVDEGTAIFKTAPDATLAPKGAQTLTLDADGCKLPSDWYLKTAQQIANTVSGASALSPVLPLAIPDNKIAPGTSITATTKLAGPGFGLSMQNDGNLVAYDPYQKALWSSNTAGKCSGACKLSFQTDGNLVLYDTAGKAYWATRTDLAELGKYPVSGLLLKAYAPYAEITDTSGDILWAAVPSFSLGFTLGADQFAQTGTQFDGAPIYLGMQSDGNLVLYSGIYNKGKVTALWSSNTAGKCSSGCHVVFQTDGNLVLYDGSNKAYWASNTAHAQIGKYATTLKISAAKPYLSITDQNGGVLWNATTGVVQG